jgi:hypothetical protein
MTDEEAAAQLAAMPESRIKGCLLWLAGLFGAAVVIALLAIIFAFLTGRDDETATPPGGPPPVDGPTAAAPGPTRSVVAPETAGGYERILEDTVKAGSGPTLADMHRSGLRNAVTGWYTTPGSPPEPQIIFYGGVLSRSLAENEVADAAQTRLDEAFRRLTAGGARRYDGTMRSFDAGPLGGQVRCTTLTSTGRSSVACGWVDQWTVGYVFDTRRGRDEAEVAALLVKMRDDFEIVNS